jgi:hypothetical protein
VWFCSVFVLREVLFVRSCVFVGFVLCVVPSYVFDRYASFACDFLIFTVPIDKYACQTTTRELSLLERESPPSHRCTQYPLALPPTHQGV